MVIKRSLFSWVLKSHHGLQLLLFCMVLVTVFFRVFPLEMQKRIVNSAIRFRNMDALLIYSGFYICAVVLAGVLKYAINVLQAYIGQKLLLHMRNQFYDHILRLPLPFFRRTPPGMVISSLTSELSTVGDFLGGALAIPAINILTLITFACYMFYLNSLLALLSVSIYPVEIFIIPYLQKRFNALNLERIDVTRSLSNAIGEAISGMHEIHANGSYPIENQKFSSFCTSLYHLRHRMNIFRFGVKFVSNFFQSLGPFILFLVGGYLSIKGRLDLGALVAFLSAYEKLYDPWKELMDYYQDLQDSRVRYYRVVDYFNAEPEFVLAPDGREPYKLDGGIEVQDVSFSVDGQIHLLDQVSVNIKPGEQLALVGFSGSGKSTLAMVLGQIYSYNGGHVLMDGKELKVLTKRDVIENIGYVAQQPFIFDGGLLDNLLYGCRSIRESNGRPEAMTLPDQERVLQLVQQVGLADDVFQFGLNAVLGHDTPRELIEKLIGIRKVFVAEYGPELAEHVEFFDASRYLYHSSVAINLTFGTANQEDFELENLPANGLFQRFLSRAQLREPLLLLGRNLAQKTVQLLRDLSDNPFFFVHSPIPVDQFELYVQIVERMDRPLQIGLTEEDERNLLRLALRFAPARHKMVALSSALENHILSARKLLKERMTRDAPDAFTFYSDIEYLHNQTILGNILFGHTKSDQPQAMTLVQQHVKNIIQNENLLNDIMGIGLQFQVGSKGDRLSGGQKQKIALARTLLKNPSILILDEVTASLDNASQARIQRMIDTDLKGKCTLVSVVHRLDTVHGYDRIAVMKAGKIVEVGSYDELIERKGIFYELVNG